MFKKIIKAGLNGALKSPRVRQAAWELLLDVKGGELNHNSLLISCFPKSGSTFTSAVIANVTGYSMASFVDSYEFNEQNLYLPKICVQSAANTVTQQHVPATLSNIDKINKFGIKNVVLVRNIFDVCISIYDHLHNESHQTPTAFINKDFFDLSAESKLDFIVDLVIPWYIKFYTSWSDVKKKSSSDFVFVRYDEILADEVHYFQRILQYWDFEFSDEEVLVAINNVKTKKIRLNAGVSGRGCQLTEEQKERIHTYTTYYPWCDFSLIYA